MSKKTTTINGGCPQFQLLMIYDYQKNNKNTVFHNSVLFSE